MLGNKSKCIFYALKKNNLFCKIRKTFGNKQTLIT